MMPLGVIGISHKTAVLKDRELFSRVCERRFGPGLFTQGGHPSVLLSTCNRIEWYFSSIDLAASHSYFLQVLREEGLEYLEPLLYCYFGADCLQHLARVTSGLDSALIGETEIQGQVKQAYEKACGRSCLPKVMHYVFQKSLKVGKDVRSTLLPQEGAPELEHAIFRLAEQHLSQFSSVRLLFVGASEINCKVLRFLKARGIGSITLCNRTAEVAAGLAQQYHIECLPWEALDCWGEFDWIIVGTRSHRFLLHGDNVCESEERKRLVIDLSVPRNVDPALHSRQDLVLYNLDQVNAIVNKRKERLDYAVNQSDVFIRRACDRLVGDYKRRNTAAQVCIAAGA